MINDGEPRRRLILRQGSVVAWADSHGGFIGALIGASFVTLMLDWGPGWWFLRSFQYRPLPHPFRYDGALFVRWGPLTLGYWGDDSGGLRQPIPCPS